MGKKIPVTKKHIEIKKDGMTYTLDLDIKRFESQYSLAQTLLDHTIMQDMIPFMPMETGTFINVTKAMSSALAGSGRVVAAAPPYGRFLYEGKTMVDEETGSTWARKGGKKVLVSQFRGKTNAKENLEFSKEHHPNAVSHWFEKAKEVSGKYWIGKAKRIAGGG